MKKFLMVCLLILSMLLCSCSPIEKFSYIDNDRTKMNDKFGEVLSVLENNDKEGLISLFSKNSLKNIDNIEEQTDSLFKYFNGSVISYSETTPGPYVSGELKEKKPLRLWKNIFM